MKTRETTITQSKNYEVATGPLRMTCFEKILSLSLQPHRHCSVADAFRPATWMVFGSALTSLRLLFW